MDLINSFIECKLLPFIESFNSTADLTVRSYIQDFECKTIPLFIKFKIGIFIKRNYRKNAGISSKIYLIFTLLILPLTVFGFSSSDSGFFITNLILDGEEDLNQCINHALQFRWSYSHFVEHLLVEMVLVEKKAEADSTIWESGVRAFDDTTFRYISLGDIHDGITYKFSIRAKAPKFGWSEWKQIEFNMNTPPSKPFFQLQNGHVFRNKEMLFPFTLSKDKELKDGDIFYQIKITSDAEGLKTLIDTTFSKIVISENSGIHICRFNFVENGEYFAKIRAHDGVEYSEWSKLFNFFVNKINEPPSQFSLRSPIHGEIIKGFPELYWNRSVAPDENLGGGLKEYSVYISIDSLFTKITDTAHLSPEVYEYQTKNLENHRTYFWKVMARDVEGLETLRYQVGSFIVDLGNAPPHQPLLLSPKDGNIFNPSDDIVFQLQDDPDPGQTERDIYYIVRYFCSDNTKKVKQVKSKPGVTSLYLPLLKEDKYYVYQVAAVDPDGNKSDLSQQVVFGVNSEDKPPEPFLILSPYFNEDSVSIDASFMWQNTYDKDPGSNIRYYLYFSTDSLFLINTKVVVLSPSEGDSVVYTPIQKFNYFTKYFWKVVAFDNFGNEIWASNTNIRPFAFTTISSRRSLGKALGPTRFYLHQNYPNPFNAETRIRYEVAKYGPIEVTIYDILGKKIKVLASGNHSPGIYDIYWNGLDLKETPVPGGMYICQMTARSFSSHRKVVLLR